MRDIGIISTKTNSNPCADFTLAELRLIRAALRCKIHEYKEQNYRPKKSFSDKLEMLYAKVDDIIFDAEGDIEVLLRKQQQ